MPNVPGDIWQPISSVMSVRSLVCEASEIRPFHEALCRAHRPARLVQFLRDRPRRQPEHGQELAVGSQRIEIVFLLEPYFENLGKRIVKTPKLYFLDTGLCSYLLGARTPEDLLRSPMLGAIFETHVLGQIVRHFTNQGRRREIYFYRDHNGREVDFLIPSAGRFALIECKWAESPGSTQRGFSELESLVGADRITRRRSSHRIAGLAELPRRSPSPTALRWSFLLNR